MLNNTIRIYTKTNVNYFIFQFCKPQHCLHLTFKQIDYKLSINYSLFHYIRYDRKFHELRKIHGRIKAENDDYHPSVFVNFDSFTRIEHCYTTGALHIDHTVFYRNRVGLFPAVVRRHT